MSLLSDVFLNPSVSIFLSLKDPIKQSSLQLRESKSDNMSSRILNLISRIPSFVGV